ncbi:MAG: putative nucleic acid-binding protein contains domain [Candidatus Solibacter sp.]|nr:putative nucleic acid-binding protein contains domain [Candidatus Solibacter sp.]
MPDAAVISNSSPLIALIQIGRLELLKQLYTSILVPVAVAREVEPTLENLPDWVVVPALADPLQPKTVSGSIRPGEREVISLGLELRTALLILDDQPVRRLATSMGLRVIGTVRILMAGKERGFLSKIKPELDRLRAVRFFMDQELTTRCSLRLESFLRAG